ncbi:phospho-sugar mutase [Saccharothrix sp. NRRL B-16314]|uniref:phospho-sugar mutase n=1 Tax=Saccharothrix sp. NRRL B-16314 TaxID=1463825 RepID=UPI000527E308|nr:phospho-sugar mutase [Saccharothrix sp. NRRL B-16314]
MNSSLTPALRDAAFRWIADDPDAATRLELQTVLARAMGGDASAADDLADRMSGPLTFGTAGLRGPVRAGPNGMNRAVVIRTTAGLAAWLKANGHVGTVFVGRDARHGSEDFAAATAGVLAGAGFTVRVLPEPLPTPVLAFLVKRHDAVAGVQITASHNPPADNGYKLYLAGGGQIVPPEDRAIEAAIRGVPAAVSVPLSDDYLPVSDAEVDEYLERVASLPRGVARELRVALTPMHGVGGATAVEALRRAGFTDVRVVREQAVPDPTFPTVSFPNPEEPGAADRLLELAAAESADLAIALDPDADRCALGVRERDGSWRMLRGDETGVLLGSLVLSTVDGPDPLVATTIVSSSLLKSIAAARGARYAETLTGFKWLVRAGEGLVFAYEEALGNCVDPAHVNDKDGISAAVVACDLAAGLKASGRTLLDALDQLAVEHGLHLTDQVSLRFTDLSRIGALTARLRADPPAGFAFEDLLPEADVVRLTKEGVRVVVRPSGTEPKLKAYLEVVEPVADDLPAARVRAEGRLAELRTQVSDLLTAP